MWKQGLTDFIILIFEVQLDVKQENSDFVMYILGILNMIRSGYYFENIFKCSILI